MIKNYKEHYVNSTIGRVYIDISDHGVVLKQEIDDVATGFISLTHEEMEKLARALFAIKKDLSSDSQLSQALSPVLPSFTKPPMATNHMDEMKAKYERAYNPWTADEEEMLKNTTPKGLKIWKYQSYLDVMKGLSVVVRRNWVCFRLLQLLLYMIIMIPSWF